MPARHQIGDPLDAATLTRVLNLVEDCGRAPDLAAFRETTVESLGRHFGYRHTTFFVGRTIGDLFADQEPVAGGLPKHVLRAYVERARPSDPFAQYAARQHYRRDRVVTLDRLDPDGLPGGRQYLESFLFRSGIHAKLVAFLRAGPLSGGIGLLSRESGAFGPRDLAIAQVLSRQLENLLRLNAQHAPAPRLHSRLSPRQAEVADLVAQGLTNREIARRLFVGVDTVKKHVTKVLAETGCANRTRLALEWQRERSDERRAG